MVVEYHHSPDYMYGTAYNTYDIECDVCTGKYRLEETQDGFALYSRADEKRSEELDKPVNKASKRIRSELTGPIVERICEEAHNLGRAHAKKAPYIQKLFGSEYTEAKIREGAKAAGNFDDFVAGLVKLENCEVLARKLGMHVPYAEIVAEYESAKAASASFKPRPVKSYTRPRLQWPF